MLLDIIGVISYIFCHLKCALALFFPYHGSARVLASRPLKMNQATSQIGHIIFELEFELLIQDIFQGMINLVPGIVLSCSI